MGVNDALGYAGFLRKASEIERAAVARLDMDNVIGAPSHHGGYRTPLREHILNPAGFQYGSDLCAIGTGIDRGNQGADSVVGGLRRLGNKLLEEVLDAAVGIPSIHKKKDTGVSQARHRLPTRPRFAR